MKFHDLVLLLDNRSERYDEVAVFARHLDPADVADCVHGRSCRITGSSGSFSLGFTYGNVWRELRVEEKLGIVVLSSPKPPEGGYAPEAGGNVLRSALQAAASVPVDELVPYTVRQEHFALLRKREGVLHRNLLMEWREIAGAPPSSFGKWMTVDCSEHSAKPFLAWVKQSLWADVPTPDLSKCKMDLGLRYPFPGADAHPDKRGGELCVEGTRVPVARILAELAEVANPAEAGRGKLWCHGLDYIVDDLDLDFDTVQKCLRGLADWLKTQNWTGWAIRKDGTQTGRWISGEELAAFRRWQAREEGKQQQAAQTERRCENCVSWLPELLRTDKCVYPYSPKSHDTAVRAEGCGYWLARSDAPDVCPRCHSANIPAGKCNDCPFERSDPLGAEGPSVKDRLADLEKDVQQLLTLEEEREADEKHAAEKRCGTCAEGRPYGHAEVRTPCNHYADSPNRPDGPPWPDCQFWKPKE